MVAVHLNATVGEDRKLILQLPQDIPPGSVEVIIRSTEVDANEINQPEISQAPKTRLSARDLLKLPAEERQRLVLEALHHSITEDVEVFEAFSEEDFDDTESAHFEG